MKSFLFAAMLAFAGSSASAAVVSWTATLDQAQEVPTPIAVPDAGGSADGTIDTETNLLTWDIMYSGLSGPAVGLHFHAPAPPGETASVVVNVGDLSGLTSPTIGSTTIPTEGTEAFLDGLYYINVHTDLNPAGEIRGQVMPAAIPVPATLPIALSAFGLLGLIARRRRS